MKVAITIFTLLLSSQILASKCCTGSCWRNGCCPPDYDCNNSEDKIQHFSRVTKVEKKDVKNVILSLYAHVDVTLKKNESLTTALHCTAKKQELRNILIL